MVGAHHFKDGVGGGWGAIEQGDDGAATAVAGDAGAENAFVGARVHEAIDEPVGFAAGEFEAEAVAVMAGEEEAAGAVEGEAAFFALEGGPVGEFFDGP